MREHPVRAKVLVPKYKGAVKSFCIILKDSLRYGAIRRKDSKGMDKSNWVNKVNPAKGYYLAGFADGEGSFNISLRKRADHTMGWQVVLTFNVSQKETYVLSQFKRILGCGRIQRRQDGLCMYVVSNPNSIFERVIPFFRRFNFLSQYKKNNFSLFVRAAKIMKEKRHLTREGLNEIVAIREKINMGRGRKRKYEKSHVDQSFSENPQRLYAKPRAFRDEECAG